MALLLFLQAGCFFLSMSLFAPHHAAAASPFSFSFDFSKPSGYDAKDLSIEGSAKLGIPVDLSCNSMVQKNDECVGRMSYSHPVPFYNNNTGEVASFATQFAFAIMLKENRTDGGDGFAFFLSRFPSTLPSSSGGGNLGLHKGDGANVSAGEGFIAVEFDTFANSYDPNPGSIRSHIGIDINTVNPSVNTTSYAMGVAMHGNMTASITFDNSTRILEATLKSTLGLFQVSTQLPDPITSLLPAEVAVGFSAATGTAIEVHQIMSWSFDSTISPPHKQDHGIPRRMVTVIVVLAALILGWLIGAYTKHQINSSMKAASDLAKAKRYEYRELANATDNFSEKNKLGEGGFGEVYMGTLMGQDGQQYQVAVKKIKGSSGGDFRAELETISETSHINLVSLEGWSRRIRFNLIYFMCWRRQKQNVFLVYQLVPNGNLHEHLHKQEKFIDWATRYNIVKDIGFALRYLHYECRKCILHRDIKPSNILLDAQFNAKLADFGLSRIAQHKPIEKLADMDPEKKLLPDGHSSSSANEHADTGVHTQAIGTMNYMDPKCMKDGIVSFTRPSDVYSFGIVLLEIAFTGSNRAVVWNLYKRNPEDVALAADPRLKGDFDVPQMLRVAILGLLCSLEDETKRPTMKEVMELLEHDATMDELTDLSHRLAESEGK